MTAMSSQHIGPVLGQISKSHYNGHSCESFRGLQVDRFTKITPKTKLSSKGDGLFRQPLHLEELHAEEDVASTAAACLNHDTRKTSAIRHFQW